MRRALVLLLGVSTFVLAGPSFFAPVRADAKEAIHRSPVDTKSIVEQVVKKHGEGERRRIERGVSQVATLWRPEDGDLAVFALEQFVASESDCAKKEHREWRAGGDSVTDQWGQCQTPGRTDNVNPFDALLGRLEYAFEMLDGHFNEIGRELRRPTDLDIGPLLPIDSLLAGFDPSAHLTEDLFTSKIGFVALLNFPLTTLKERVENGSKWDRKTWAAVRLAGRFARRVPGDVQQAITKAGSEAEIYIAQYNIWMHHLVDAKGERLFPKGLRLITHWNLRDELKADYADPRGLDKQRTILQVMERIVTQTIPAAVIDNPHVDWNPFTNVVTVAPTNEVESDAPTRPAIAKADPEPNTRYQKMLAQYQAARLADPYSPTAPTYIARSFELFREIPEERVTALLRSVLESPLVPKVAALIEQRLGRKLGPQDIWYNGFQARGRIPEEQLDKIVRNKYPTPEAFAKDIPNILDKLGFDKSKAEFLAAHIVVDPSRGAGHALQSGRRGDFPHLRTRVEKDGMNYKGYNIAVHELGHNIEQVFSLYEVDHTLLQGVPNNAFTEALAFVFQAKDLELLGLSKPDAESERMRVLNDFWQTWEIAGVALVDIAVWHWMYDHPKATPAELQGAVVTIAREHWNRYYAPILGQKDDPQLGIYSHMISYPIYLCDYVIGHLIAFQIEEHIKKVGQGRIGPEFERMAKQGSILPDLWMQGATGAPVGAGPLLRATEAALQGH